MTPRSLFTILIKVIGIYIVLGSITVVPQFFSTLFMLYNESGINDSSGTAMAVIMIMIVMWLYFLLLRYCLFRTDRIIDKLSLDKHFIEEKFELNIHRSTVLSIAIIVIGGLMFVEALPVFCREIFVYFQQKQSSILGDEAKMDLIAIQGGKLVIGYLLMTNSRKSVSFIERQRKKIN